MKIEFYADKTGTFKPVPMYRELGSQTWQPIASMGANLKRIVYMLFMDNTETHKLITTIKKRGETNIDAILTHIVDKKFSRLTAAWDIDERTLNFES